MARTNQPLDKALLPRTKKQNTKTPEKEPQEDNTTNRLKERAKLAEELASPQLNASNDE